MQVVKENLSASNGRLNIRLLPEIKARIQRAAHILGQDLTEFTSNILNREAQEIIENHEQILLSERDYTFFTEALNRPAQKPSERSLNSLKEYQRIFEKENSL